MYTFRVSPQVTYVRFAVVVIHQINIRVANKQLRSQRAKGGGLFLDTVCSVTGRFMAPRRSCSFFSSLIINNIQFPVVFTVLE